jgi:ribosome-associated protein
MIKIVKKIREIIDDKKGEDIVIIDISKSSGFADFFVNATATNERQLLAIRDELDDKLEGEGGIFIKGTEGQASSGWILMDYGDIIVNLFLPDKRDLYNIEKLWGDCERVD